MTFTQATKIITIILCICIFTTSNLYDMIEKIRPTTTNVLITVESLTTLLIILFFLERKQEEQERTEEPHLQRRAEMRQEQRLPKKPDNTPPRPTIQRFTTIKKEENHPHERIRERYKRTW